MSEFIRTVTSNPDVTAVVLIALGFVGYLSLRVFRRRSRRHRHRRRRLSHDDRLRRYLQE